MEKQRTKRCKKCGCFYIAIVYDDCPDCDTEKVIKAIRAYLAKDKLKTGRRDILTGQKK